MIFWRAVRPLLHQRRGHLEKMLRRRVDGIILTDVEQGEIRSDRFRAACNMGLEDIVSKTWTGHIEQDDAHA